MDINTLRGLATLFALVAFILMLLWVYSSKRRKDYDEAAALPFADESFSEKPFSDKKGNTPALNNSHTTNEKSSRNRGVTQ